MLYTYVLFNERDGRSYTGTTGVLRQGIRQHAKWEVRSTAYRHPRSSSLERDKLGRY
ncbi:MAG: hypothetical protein ACE5G5_00360 [Candidatus Methylomirabilales bacterium]